MRDDVYKEFSAKMKPIIQDCIVTKEIANSDSTKYSLYPMEFIGNKGSILYYNRKKVIDKYSDDIKYLCSIIPQRKSRVSVNQGFVDLTSLIPDSTLKVEDKARRAKLLKVQANIIEAFFAFAEEVDLGVSEVETKYPVLHLFQKIPTNYKEIPDNQEPNR